MRGKVTVWRGGGVMAWRTARLLRVTAVRAREDLGAVLPARGRFVGIVSGLAPSITAFDSSAPCELLFQPSQVWDGPFGCRLPFGLPDTCIGL